MSLCTHNPDRSTYNYFSIFVQFFSRNGPSFFSLSLLGKHFHIRRWMWTSILLTKNWVSWIFLNIWRDTESKWTHRLLRLSLKESEHENRVLCTKLSSGGKHLYIQRFSEKTPRLWRAGLPFTSVETNQKIWGPPFSNFHWSPCNLQVFKFSLESP